MTATQDSHDGFEVVTMQDGEVVDFIPCSMNHDSMRERVLMGLLRNMDRDRYFVRDTRDAKP